MSVPFNKPTERHALYEKVPAAVKTTHVDIDTPENLSALAWKDQSRIVENIKRNVPGLVVFTTRINPNEWVVVRRGTGPEICVSGGYDQFKSAYMAAENVLMKNLVDELASLVDPGLIFEWHHQRDAMCAIWGDTGQHRFSVLRRRVPGDPIV